MRVETDSNVRLKGNVTAVLTGSFVDPAQGDLHLKTAVPGAVFSAESRGWLDHFWAESVGKLDDIDGQDRDNRPDAGADEYR